MAFRYFYFFPAVSSAPFCWPPQLGGWWRASTWAPPSWASPSRCKLPQVTPSLLTHFLPGFAWLADQVDMTGFRNSVVFLGGNSGWLIFPPVAGIIIFSGPGGVGVYLLSLGAKSIPEQNYDLTFIHSGICVAQLLLVGLMLKLATLKE